jgi:hypothetical protein
MCVSMRVCVLVVVGAASGAAAFKRARARARAAAAAAAADERHHARAQPFILRCLSRESKSLHTSSNA